MTQDVFDKHVLALATKRLEKPKKLSAQHARFWSEISSQHYNFERGMISFTQPYVDYFNVHDYTCIRKLMEASYFLLGMQKGG